MALDRLEKTIYLIRGEKVILDEDLARLYQVPTRVLIQAVKRNQERFPDDFMFQLTSEEYSTLRSQFVTASGRTGRRTRPYAFTEHGVAMLASVLRSSKAIGVSITIVRVFIKMRQLISEHKDLSVKLDQLERRYDAQFRVVFNSIRELINSSAKVVKEDPPPKRRIGFGS